MNHPLVGQLTLHANPLHVAHVPDAWMLVYTPAPETDTLAKLEQLLGLSAEDETAMSVSEI
jgi:MmyB-like transcription regulator ligand binding domain